MPASLPPRKDPPARRMTRAAAAAKDPPTLASARSQHTRSSSAHPSPVSHPQQDIPATLHPAQQHHHPSDVPQDFTRYRQPPRPASMPPQKSRLPSHHQNIQHNPPHQQQQQQQQQHQRQQRQQQPHQQPHQQQPQQHQHHHHPPQQPPSHLQPHHQHVLAHQQPSSHHRQEHHHQQQQHHQALNLHPSRSQNHLPPPSLSSARAQSLSQPLNPPHSQTPQQHTHHERQHQHQHQHQQRQRHQQRQHQQRQQPQQIPQPQQQPRIQPSHHSFAAQSLPPASHPQQLSSSHQQNGPAPVAVPTPANQDPHIYSVSMGLSTVGMAPPQQTALQYSNQPYPNAGFFDQFNMSSAIPLSIPGQNPAVSVVRDMDRQSQPQPAQIQSRTTAAQALRKGFSQSAQDIVYQDPSQAVQHQAQVHAQAQSQSQQQHHEQQLHQQHVSQQSSHQRQQQQRRPQQQQRQQQQQQQQQHMMQRPSAMQAHPQQDIQGHPLAQQHMQQQLYQPLDPQQNAQHLLMNHSAAFVPQAAQVGMRGQAAQLQQPSHLASQDPHFDQHAYASAHQGPLTNVNTIGLQPDLQGRKGVNATNQAELLAWNNGPPPGRVVSGAIGQQGTPDMAPAIAPGTLLNPSGFAPSHIFDMGMADMRQQGPHGQLALQPPQQHQPPPHQPPQHQPQQQQPQQQQHTQALKQETQTQPPSVLSNVRKAAQTTDSSPRKRRQTNSGAAQGLPPLSDPATSGRTFSCSGCGQDFALKRDRDNHVRTVHERSFSCSKCTSRFKTKSDANRHVRIVHDRQRPYACPSCTSTFSERNKLRRHQETVHQKLRPFACPVCAARFGELGNLRQHTGSLHPEVSLNTAEIRSRALNTQIQS